MPTESGDATTVLLVDDDRSLLQSLTTALARHGYSVLPAADEEAAIRIVEGFRGRLDLALLDIVLDETTGAQLGMLVAERHPEAVVLFMSGHASDDPVLRGSIDADVNFIEKPFEIEELVGAIEGFLAEE